MKAFNPSFDTFYQAKPSVLGPNAPTVFALNTVVFSPAALKCGDQSRTVAGNEINWLTKQLPVPSGKVWLLGHIPPGDDPYADAASYDPALYDAFQKTLCALPPDALGFFGHQHHLTYRTITDSSLKRRLLSVTVFSSDQSESRPEPGFHRADI